MTRNLSQATVHPEKVKPSSAVSRWSMNNADVDSGTIKDTWGSNNGTINNGGDSTMTGASGVGYTGEAFTFDGNNDYVDISTSFAPSSYTISLWSRNNSLTNKDIQIAALNGGSVVIRSESNGKQYLYHKDSGGTWHSISTETEIKTWFNWTATWNGNQIKIYKNGALASKKATASIYNGSALEAIGRDSTGKHFNGKIDEVRIYSEALTQQQIWKLYNIGRNANWGYSRS